MKQTSQWWEPLKIDGRAPKYLQYLFVYVFCLSPFTCLPFLGGAVQSLSWPQDRYDKWSVSRERLAKSSEKTMGSNGQEYTVVTSTQTPLCTRFKSSKTTTGIYLLQQHPKIASCWQCFGHDTWIFLREETNYNPKGQGLRTTKNIVWPWHPKSFHLWSSICSLSGESPWDSTTPTLPRPSTQPWKSELGPRKLGKISLPHASFAWESSHRFGDAWCLPLRPGPLVDHWRPKPIKSKLDQVAIVGKYGVMERRLVMICQPIVSTGMMQHVPKDLPCPHPSRPPGTWEAHEGIRKWIPWRNSSCNGCLKKKYLY